MKKLLLLSLSLLFCSTTYAEITETATDAVKNMGLGWNLGNTLDAHSHTVTPDVTKDTYWGCQGLDSETCWGQRTTKKEIFPLLKKAGFGAIRIPVTWYNHMDKDGKVNAEWMARVKTVVDWCLDAGLYCIINVHHDTGADSSDGKSIAWLKADMTTYNNQKDRYENLWKQIAEEFKNYDEHLLFESYNEMLDKYSSWCFASFNSSSKYNATDAADAYNAINNYAQSFVNVVRASGGNNGTRNLVVNTYGACCGSGTWNTHLAEPLSEMKLPKDDAQNHLIFEVHSYPNIASNTISAVKSEIDQNISVLKQHLVSKGAPVIIGEWGTSNVDNGSDYADRRDKMFEFVDYYVQQMKANDIGTFYWMGLTDGIYRDWLVFNQADLAERIAKAYHGSSFVGEYPEANFKDGVTVFEGEQALAWGTGITIQSDLFKSIGSNVHVKVTYKITSTSSPDIQFYYADWSAKPSIIADGKTNGSDFNPYTFYTGLKTGVEKTTDFNFTSTVYNNLAQKGLILHGNTVTITKVLLYDPKATAIEEVEMENPQEDGVFYNLSGQRVNGKSQQGLFISNGKIIMRTR